MGTWRAYRNIAIPSSFLAIAQPPLFDDAVLAYSFRKLISTYTGSAVRIRRSSDNAEQDFGFDGAGDFDTAGTAAFIGAGSGFIATWYDQAENIDLSRSTADGQPLYVASGTGGRPTADFDEAGTADYLEAASIDLSLYLQSQVTVFCSMTQEAASAQNTIIAWRSTSAIGIHATWDDEIFWDMGSFGAGGRVAVAQPTGWDDNPHLLELYRESNDNQVIVVDGTQLAQATRTDDITSGSATFLMGQVASIGLHDGYIQELVIWGTDIGSANRSLVRTNINNYYSIF